VAALNLASKYSFTAAKLVCRPGCFFDQISHSIASLTTFFNRLLDTLSRMNGTTGFGGCFMFADGHAQLFSPVGDVHTRPLWKTRCLL